MKVSGYPVKVRVQRTAFGNVNVDDYTIDVRKFVTTPAIVKVSVGTSLEASPKQWLRADVGIELPCYREEIDEAYNEAREFVERKLDAMVKEWVDELRGVL